MTSNAASTTVDLDGERAALGARPTRPCSASWHRSPASPAAAPTPWPTSTSTPSCAGAIEKLQHELVVFGRIDDDQPWRVGLYGIDQDGDQLVIDWRAPFAEGFYQAGLRRAARASTGGSATSAASTTCSSRTSPPARSPARRRCSPSCPAAAAPRCAPRSPRSSPSRTRSSASTRPRGSCCAAGRAPARRSSASTGRRGSSTTTAASPPTASSCSARATGSCASCPPVLPDARRGPHRPDHLRPAPRPVRPPAGSDDALARRARPVRGRRCSTPAEIQVGLARASESTRSPS